jgi:hypothetical protein
VIARIVEIRHKQAGNRADWETETRLDLEVLTDRRIKLRFNRLGVVELL